MNEVKQITPPGEGGLNKPLSIADRVAQQQADAARAASESQQNYNTAQNQFFQNQQDYVTGKRNPVADMIRKPERDAAERLKQVAKWSFLGDAIGLIGKGYAASRGVMPSKTGGVGTFQALNELNRLDDIYRQEGDRYDHNMVMDAIRRQGAADDLERTKLGLAQSEASYNRGRADKLESMALNLELDKERTEAAKAEKADDRAYTEKQSEKNFKREWGLRNNHVANAQKVGSTKTGTERYSIRGSDGEPISVTKEMETQILSEAIKNGIINDGNKDKTISLLQSDPSNSPTGRAEIQRLYNETVKKLSETKSANAETTRNKIGQAFNIDEYKKQYAIGAMQKRYPGLNETQLRAKADSLGIILSK